VQHPAHDIELQTQTPPEHIWPTPQAGPAPQLQTPEGEQLSASLELQETQAIPSVPQLANTDVVHVAPLQHPPGHEVELQMHLPCEQTCPGPQGPDDPQLHAPAAEQLSALAATHAEQATPATPQVANAEVSQVAPEQQPLGQLAAVQPVQAPPASQFWFDGQVAHAEPPPPHIASLVPGSHVLPEQHPWGQEVPLHTHAPRTHICPVVHAAPEPQVQAPLAEQPSATAPHATHASPAVPHARLEAGSHTLP
jgi:hypothetical protein